MQEPLFPLPEVGQKRQRGRPKLELTKQKQELIRYALRGGMSPNAIGLAMGYDPKTIRAHFSGIEPRPDAEVHRAADRLRRMGSELHRISADLLNLPSDGEAAE